MEARLQIGDPIIILANGQRFTMFFYVMHTTERHRDYKIDYSIADIVSDIILLRLRQAAHGSFIVQCSSSIILRSPFNI